MERFASTAIIEYITIIEFIIHFQVYFKWPECSRQREGASRLSAPQLCQVTTLQLHHHVVKPRVATATYETADMFFACKEKKTRIKDKWTRIKESKFSLLYKGAMWKFWQAHTKIRNNLNKVCVYKQLFVFALGGRLIFVYLLW